MIGDDTCHHGFADGDSADTHARIMASGRRNLGFMTETIDGAARSPESKMDDVQQRIQTAIAAFGRGDLVIVTDDDDRENEGDLFVAGSLCTPEKMAFIIRHTSGIVCAR